MLHSQKKVLPAPDNIPKISLRKREDLLTKNTTLIGNPENKNENLQGSKNETELFDSDDLPLIKSNFSNVDDIEDVTHMFLPVHTPKRPISTSTISAIEDSSKKIPNKSQGTGQIYPWLNNRDEGVLKPKLTETDLSKNSKNRNARKNDKNRNRNRTEENIERRNMNWRRRRRQKMKELLRHFCNSDDFRGVDGQKCCHKSIRCFGDLPALLDEIDNYNEHHDEHDDTDREHVCSHIKDSMLCMGHAMALPACKNSVAFVNRKLNTTLHDVTEFHKESCKEDFLGPPFKPTASPSDDRDEHGGIRPHSHPHGPSNTAAILGGIIGGSVLVLLIILLILLWRRKRKRPSEISGKDVSGGTTLSNGSSRYKTHFGLSRKQSEVYAEIDESSMHSNQSLSSDKRPLPSAPTNGTLTDNAGYLTPRGSRDRDLAGMDRDSGGYHILQKETNRKPSVDTYEKLNNDEGDYINPSEIGNQRNRIESEKGHHNPAISPNEDGYHMYFVLEKEKEKDQVHF